MKSPDALLIPNLIAAVLAATALAGCGQTGPLTMPQPPARPAAMTPAPAVPVQAPATPAPAAATSNDLPTPAQ